MQIKRSILNIPVPEPLSPHAGGRNCLPAELQHARIIQLRDLSNTKTTLFLQKTNDTQVNLIQTTRPKKNVEDLFYLIAYPFGKGDHNQGINMDNSKNKVCKHQSPSKGKRFTFPTGEILMDVIQQMSKESTLENH